MGRPLKPIDGEQVFKLARLGCTQEEIADFFGCHADTIRDRFSSELTRARAAGKISLRRAQMRRAIQGRSDSMLIHLGKQMLGQSEKAEVKTTAEHVVFERVDSPRDQAVPPPAEAAGVKGRGDGGPDESIP